MATAIAFRSVTKRFPSGKLGLADATWFIAEGAQACLVGPRGAGKTTALRLLQGALRPTGGSVSLLEVPLGDARYREARRRLGVVPKAPGMYPDLTAGEFLALAGRLCGERPDRAIDALDLTDSQHTRMTDLSPGLQRRLALAAALIPNPDVLVMDDPTAGLERVEAEDLRHHLGAAMQGRTALLCTTDWAEARLLCQDVIVLRAGRVVDQGTWDELRIRSGPRYRVEVRQGVDAMRAALPEAVHLEPDGRGAVLSVTDPELDPAELLRRVVAADLDVYEWSPLPSLDVEGKGQDRGGEWTSRDRGGERSRDGIR